MHLFCILRNYFFLVFLICLNEIRCTKWKSLHNNKNKVEGKIVGGSIVPIERYPHAVKFYNFGALCAGTILNVWTVMTAAHCFDYNTDTSEMMLRVGARFTNDANAQSYSIWHYIRHEDYNKAMAFSCDIALIFVERPMALGKTAKRGVLVNTNKWMDPKEQNFTSIGWGWTKYQGQVSNSLMMTNLKYVDRHNCSILHKIELSEDMFCLYGDGVRDSCRGDSGGPIEWHRMIVGIVSHGDGCAKKDKPSVYSNVWYFRNWIQKTIDYFLNTYCKTGLNRT